MNYNFTSFTNSILQNSKSPLDFYSPVSFATWLEQKNSGGSLDVNQLFKYYNDYVIEWGRYKNKTASEVTDIIKSSYIQVLKDLVINYSTEEEKRFITNADFNDPYDLDIILNFFVNKLKTVCTFYSDQREILKTASIQHNLKGSNLGIETFVKKAIFDTINTNQLDFSESSTIRFPPLSSVAQNINVYVEELYDVYQNYFNINPSGENFKTKDVSNLRLKLSGSNIAGINDPYLYLNLKESIKSAILEYDFYVDSLGINNFVVNPILSGTELQYLKERDFINYLSGGTNDLKLNLIKRINPKFLSNDFYYLSTGATVTNRVSGLLFTVLPLTGAPTLNLLNRHYPTTASVPNLSSLYAAVELGRFFLPQHTGLLVHNTPNKQYYLESESLKPNSLYAFPDPKIIGNVSYNSNSDNLFSPFLYRIDVSWNKVSRSNNFRFAEVLSNSYNPLYFGYQSETQDLQMDYEGLCRTSDNLQFWEGNFQEVWSNSSWPGLNIVEKLPLESRQKSLLTGENTLIQWNSDKFGNEYGLFKNVFSLKTPQPLTARNILLPYGDTEYVEYTSIEDTKVSQRKNAIPGKLYFKDIVTSVVVPASAALSGIFLKYPQIIKEQFNNNLIKFNVYYDTFVAELEDYVVIDTIDYDFIDNKVINTNIPSNYFSKFLSEKRLEKYLGHWYAESESAMYVGFLRLLPYLSASNYRALYPVIYRSPLPNIKFSKVYPDDSIDIFKTYSLSSNETDIPEIDLFNVNSIYFSKVEKNNLFNITYLAKNRNGMPYFVNEQLLKSEPYLRSNLPKLFKPFYYNLDNNYSNQNLPYYVKYNSSYSRTVGTHFNDNRTFNIGDQDNNFVVYKFKDNIEPVQINSMGTYIIQFDWETYNSTNLFLGCNFYNVRNIDNNIIWNNQFILSSYNEKRLISTFVALDSYVPSPTGSNNKILIITGTAAYSINNGNSAIQLSNLSSQLSSYFVYTNGGIDTDYGKILVSIDDTTTLYLVTSSNNLNSLIIQPVAQNNVVAGSTISIYASSSFIPVYTTINAYVNRPVYPDPSILEISFTSSISTFSGVFCDAPNSIFKTVNVVKRGPGTGILFMDPFCIDCGDVCSDTFAIGTTLTLVASASFLSLFSGWESYVCLGTDNCTFTVTDNTSITANFDPAPTRTLEVAAGVGTTITTDGTIFASAGMKVKVPYKLDTVIYLSTAPAPSGYFFTGYQGNPCNFYPLDRRTWCLFTMFDNFSITASYVPIQYWDLTLDVVNVYENWWGVPYGRVYSIPQGINCFGAGYNDSGSCSGTFLGGPQYPLFTYLSAVPEKGWRFKRWVGNLIDNKFDNPVAFNLTGNIAVSAEFDLGYYRLDVVTVGGGLCRTITTNPLGIDCTTSLLSAEKRDKAGCFTEFLSGTEVTLFSFGLPGNTVTALYGPNGENIVVQPLKFRLTDNVTISAECINGEVVLLTVQNNLSSCYVINTIPGNMSIAPDSVSGFQRSVKFFPKSAQVTVTVSPTGNSTTCLPFSGFYGPNIQYKFAPGTGIRMTSPVNLLSGGEKFNTTNASILMTTGGAPFVAGTGLTVIQGDVIVNMTDNITLTALSF